ncbi:alpha/beta fold hydrolase [Longispora albida]|uniref:alpha/beta fold hydrolase n=1 Tax=Longispora albida TaxID=203523 RepID=UPI00037D2C3D|nr:alpha/beta hydrolase [Longispora albida]
MNRLVIAPGVELETLSTGHGQPTTVFAHGLGGGIADTRVLGSGVRGTKVYFQFRGHGASIAPPGDWTYEHLAGDLRGVADATGATRALGVSLGAGAMLRMLTETPDRFDRVVFFLPAILDQPRSEPGKSRLAGLLTAIAAGDQRTVEEFAALDVPAELRATTAARAFIVSRARTLIAGGLGESLAGLTGQSAIPDRSALAKVAAQALVLGCRGDVLHPAEVAEELADSLPAATLHVYDEPQPLWRHRSDIRDRISGFLNA